MNRNLPFLSGSVKLFLYSTRVGFGRPRGAVAATRCTQWL
jgi:hypothetical protein